MPKATPNPTTTRRAVVAGAASLPVVALAAVSAVLPPPTIAAGVTTPHRDAELLALLAQFGAYEQRARATWIGADTMEAEDAGEPVRAACFAGQERILDAICATPAHTLEGMKARARAVLLYGPPLNRQGTLEEVAADREWFRNERLLAALLRDMTVGGVA